MATPTATPVSPAGGAKPAAPGAPAPAAPSAPAPNPALECDAAKAVLARLGADVLGTYAERGLLTIDVSAGRNVEVMRALRDDLGYDCFVDCFAVDYADLEGARGRFCVTCQVERASDHHRVVVRAFLDAGSESIRSISALYGGALWTEREAHDMFGIDFAGNPDLRRLLMPDDFQGFPLRKEFPLHGVGYREGLARYENYTPPWHLFPERELPLEERLKRQNASVKEEFGEDAG
ncbi:MAG: NADH-quinone oxidoreductase subunit C [Planctomycetes bacterium]|nr:NADH-quinone oxidoreductase subunit C [Planctomycetota bacterium]